MVFRHIEHLAITQKIDLRIGNFAPRFHPKDKVFEGSDVSAIRPGLKGAPIPTRSGPSFVAAALEPELERRMAAMGFNGLWFDRASFWVGPASSLAYLFTIPDYNLLYELGLQAYCAKARD